VDYLSLEKEATRKLGIVLLTHSGEAFLHSFWRTKHHSEQGLSRLFTNTSVGYYYYLYIDKTSPQANPTTLNLKLGLSKRVNAMKDFQLKKMGTTK